MTFDKQTVIIVVLCASALLALAMWLGLDLSWVPEILKGLMRNGAQ